jgi:putative ABC transport system permease protein
MIRHLCKLVWNRKRSNALMIVEICISFLVVFVVATLGLFFLDNDRRPLGYEWKPVWNVGIGMGQSEAGVTKTPEQSAAQQAIFARLLREVRSLGPVEAAAGSFVIPFDQGGWSGVYKFKGRRMEVGIDRATVGFDKTMGLDLVAGRWFEEADAGHAWEPIVINREVARKVYGAEDPIGKPFADPRPGESPFRVVGVVSDFRKGGELMPVDNFMFRLASIDHPEGDPTRNLLVRVRPGTPVEFEEALVKRMQAVAPDWSFEVKPLRQVRATAFRFFLTPLTVAGTIAFFLLLMVGLGLIGVLWQNLLQRTREIGLRRAAGASRAAVHTQILLEQLVLTGLGVLIGTLLVVQIPVLDLIGVLTHEVFLGGLLFAMITMILISVLCALYPSAMASRVAPAEALRYE